MYKGIKAIKETCNAMLENKKNCIVKFVFDTSHLNDFVTVLRQVLLSGVDVADGCICFCKRRTSACA